MDECNRIIRRDCLEIECRSEREEEIRKMEERERRERVGRGGREAGREAGNGREREGEKGGHSTLSCTNTNTQAHMNEHL